MEYRLKTIRFAQFLDFDGSERNITTEKYPNFSLSSRKRSRPLTSSTSRQPFSGVCCCCLDDPCKACRLREHVCVLSWTKDSNQSCGPSITGVSPRLNFRLRGWMATITTLPSTTSLRHDQFTIAMKAKLRIWEKSLHREVIE